MAKTFLARQRHDLHELVQWAERTRGIFDVIPHEYNHTLYETDRKGKEISSRCFEVIGNSIDYVGVQELKNLGYRIIGITVADNDLHFELMKLRNKI